MVRFTFHRDAGFSYVWIIELLQIFDRGISKQNQDAFETVNRLVDHDIPQRIRLVDRTRFAIVDAIEHVVDRALVLVAQRLGQISVCDDFVFQRQVGNGILRRRIGTLDDFIVIVKRELVRQRLSKTTGVKRVVRGQEFDVERNAVPVTKRVCDGFIFTAVRFGVCVHPSQSDFGHVFFFETDVNHILRLA